MKYLWRNPYFFYRDTPFERTINEVKKYGDLGPVCLYDLLGSVSTPAISFKFPDIQAFVDARDFSSSGTYHETMMSRLGSILSHARETGLKIAFWYSGGIDSASIACGLQRIARDDDRIEILANSDSEREYPAQYAELAARWPVVDSSDFGLWFRDDVLNVDGAYGDTLFGSSVIDGMIRRGLVAPEFPYAYEKDVPTAIEPIVGAEAARTFYTALRPHRDLIDSPALRAYDLFWLQGLFMNYQDLNLIPFIRTTAAYKMKPEALEAAFQRNLPGRVFGTPEFMRFALDYGSKRQQYERPRECSLKYILACNNDLDYYTNKAKEFSQGRIYQKSPVGAIRDDWSFEFSTTYRL